MQNSENAIEVRNVSKQFKVFTNARSLKDLIVYHNFKSEIRHVLDDISFDVKKGEALGIIGRNGSGKSTTLKLLTRILRPNTGSIETDGKMSCLIELGAGFHPDMTGRENVYMNASIFGLDKKTIDERFEDIVEFSGIRDYIDERVRNYSSGMYLRLAFAIAINVDADILVVDEILAVGDVSFQEKCMNQFHKCKEKGMTTVIVSHSPDAVQNICDKVIWIEKGKIRMYGEPKTVCDAYIEFMKEHGEER